MPYPPVPSVSKSQINRAGDVLIDQTSTKEQQRKARQILNDWRACHAFPISIFQATLHRRVKPYKNSIVAQRLKRLPTIIDKLRRFPNMDLVRMQDIGGVRAVVTTIKEVRALDKLYRDSARLQHELVNIYDYIDRPKSDGYRGVHLIYKYKNTKNSNTAQYNGLLLELQLRTRLQHTWATAVETMGTFFGQALKSQQGNKKWLEFFRITSSSFAHLEKTALVPGFKKLSDKATFDAVKKAEKEINALETIRGVAVAGKALQTKTRGQGWYYHLIILNSDQHTVSITSYPKAQLSQASIDYAKAEEEAVSGARIEPVLVAAGSIESLRSAYPNYFLDVNQFVYQVERILALSNQG